MFSNVLQGTAISGNIADKVFRGVNGEGFRGDVTFVSTMRFMFHGVKPEDENVFLYVRRIPLNMNRLGRSTIAGMTDEYGTKPSYLENGDIEIFYFDGFADTERDGFINQIAQKFAEEYPEWERIQKVTDLFYKNLGAVYFVHRETKRAVLFTDRMNMKTWHYIQCATFGLFPWYFDPSIKVSPEKKDMLMALMKGDDAAYLKCLEDFAKQFDFRTMAIREMLGNFENDITKRELSEANYKLTDINNRIERLKEEMIDWMRKYDAESIRYIGLETRAAKGTQGESEIMEYFIVNPQLYLENSYDGSVYFTVKGDLDYYDVESAEAAINESDSYVYETYRNGGPISKAQMKMLMEEIFLKQRLKVQFCAAYMISAGGSYKGYEGHLYPTDCEDCMPNPHIHYHGCLGNYRVQLSECLAAHNYVGAIDRCVESAKSLSFNDYTVIKEFMVDMYKSDKACVRLPDGKVVKPVEAVAWLEAEKAED